MYSIQMIIKFIKKRGLYYNYLRRNNFHNRDLKMKSLFKYKIYILSMLIIGNSCNENSYSEAICDRTEFHENNKLNDTCRLVFEDRVVFDTTANRLSGEIIDSASGNPIPKVYILVTQSSKELLDSSDENGKFTFFKNNFSGNWQMLIRDKDHRCLQIGNIHIGGGLQIRIRLSDRLY